MLKIPRAEKIKVEKSTAVKSPLKSPPLSNTSHIIPRLDRSAWLTFQARAISLPQGVLFESKWDFYLLSLPDSSAGVCLV